MSGPSLSVVIPYFRGAAMIGNAVRSALEQTRPPDEIVICDDGSPDDLEAALGPLLDEVEIVRKANGGIASAMNAATAAARGDFLIQLDQDDAFLPGRLAAIEAVLVSRPDVDVVATDAFIESSGRPIQRLANAIPFQVADERLGILRQCFFLWPAIRRSLLEAIGGYDETFPVMQDWECFIRLMLAGAVAAYVDEPLYRWRLTPDSWSSSDRVANQQALVRMMRKTLARSDLDTNERALAERMLVAHESNLAKERSRTAVMGRGRGARKQLVEVATRPRLRPSTRAKILAAALSPGLARVFIVGRAERDPEAEALARRGFRYVGQRRARGRTAPA